MEMDMSATAAEQTQQARQTLATLLVDCERSVVAIATEFEDLADDAREMLALAAGVVGCVANESVMSVLPMVETLGVTARRFIQRRLDSATELMSTVRSEEVLVERLALQTRGQKAIARETRLLCVLTKIEVAHLGQAGEGFQYLAHELESFSEVVTDGTEELAHRTEDRRHAIRQTARLLSIAMPRIRHDFVRIEAELNTMPYKNTDGIDEQPPFMRASYVNMRNYL